MADFSSINIDNLPNPILTDNAREVLKRRYLKTDQNGDPAEPPKQMFWRVAKTIAKEEEKYENSPYDSVDLARQFYDMMRRGIFVPNSPTLFNAGRELGQLSACFVLPVLDSMSNRYSDEPEAGILDTLRDAGIIHQSGGGTGFAFSRLRPEGSRVGSTGGVASGPVSFMKIYDAMTEQVKQGGHRRGANMGILRVDHPDVIKFINSKYKQGEIENFNISVAVTDEFMEAVENDEEFVLDHDASDLDPIVVNARDLFDLIVDNAWRNGEPGLFFIDEANRHNPVPHLGDYEATNPCGEQPLLPYDVCNLGSINLGKFVWENDYKGEKDPVDNVKWDALEMYCGLAIRFLDNVIDANNYPLKQISDLSQSIRRIGFGPMGLADMLIRLGLSYDSQEARDFCDELAKQLHNYILDASEQLAEERGVFPEWEESVWGPDATCARDDNDNRIRPMRRLRNSNLNTVAPTGTISIIAGCSGGIEPLYAVAFMRNQAGTQMPDVNDDFIQIAKEEGFYSEELEEELAESGDLKKFYLPSWIKKLFVVSGTISPQDHIDMQAVWQRHTDSAISKTINFPSEATREDVRQGYIRAYKNKCKGVTVYRDGSRDNQVLSTGKTRKSGTDLALNICPECEGELIHAEGCVECQACNWSKCSI